MGSLSIWHWLIVLVVVVLIFGTKKLRNLGTDLGGAVKGFKDGMKSEEDKAAQAKPHCPRVRRRANFRLIPATAAPACPPSRDSTSQTRGKMTQFNQNTLLNV